MKHLGVVVIGRNEGAHLRDALLSARREAQNVVYVDSHSRDNSISIARSVGVDMVEVDRKLQPTAARARNTGAARLIEQYDDIQYIQFMDGDCRLQPGWLEAAMRKIESDNELAIVCGRRRELNRNHTIYNRLCDMEWDQPTGDVLWCGGDFLARVKAFREVNGFDSDLIAGEEPELCFRLRDVGWRIHRLDKEMTQHDARMRCFGEWWQRAVRSGYAYAEGRSIHGNSIERFCAQNVRSNLFWAVVLPVTAVSLAWFTWGGSLFLSLGYCHLWWRVRRGRIRHGDSAADAGLYARYIVLGKFAETRGMLKFWGRKLFGRRPRLIEYKDVGRAVSS